MAQPDPNMEAIRAFHDKFELLYEGQVRQLPQDLFDFRSGFLREEVIEFEEAYEAEDLEQQIDALVDLQYVLLGTAHLMGITPELWTQLFTEVHTANMRKVRAETAADSKRASTFDVVKPENWVGPDLGKFIAGNG